MARLTGLIAAYIILLTVGCSDANKSTETSAKKGQAVDSVELLSELIAKDSLDYNLFKQRASLYLNQGNIDPAMRDIGSAIELNREDADLFIMLGDVYFIIGQTDNCISAYKRAVQLAPKSEKPLIKLAETYLVLQQYDLASRYLDGAISTNINNPKSSYLKGILALETGDTLAALTNLKIAINIDSTYYNALMQAGGILLSMNDSTALNYYSAVLKTRPADENALFFVAVYYQEAKKYDEALNAYYKVNELHPSNKYSFFNAGYISLVEMLDFNQAALLFQRAVEIDSAYTDAVYNLGRTYEEMGRFDEARIQYQKALELVTNYPLAIEGMNRLDSIKYPD